MKDCCGVQHGQADFRSGVYRRVLWIVLALNASMFFVEVIAGLAAGSVSLQADALDFLGDAANYGISLFVLGMSLRWRASAALVKGLSMGVFGVWVFGHTGYHVIYGGVPSAIGMGGIGTLALAVNVLSAVLLFAYRKGDSNMRSVWLCSRNDALGNIAVLVAASGVFVTSAGWPDLAVGAIMAALALIASIQIIRQARGELREAKAGAFVAGILEEQGGS